MSSPMPSTRAKSEPNQPSPPASPGVTQSNTVPPRFSMPPDNPAVPGENASMPPGSPGVQASASYGESSVLQRWDNITKSESDKREYRVLVLSNRMKVMLVSDRHAEMTAASLEVNVGYYSDPDDLPGLAHFCEHMLFLGTEKYPEENGYEKFLSEHGGACNAGTGADYTVYYFNVLPDYLGAALDMFAQFFISPLFTESGTERELDAVESEYQNRVCLDECRQAQLATSHASPGHPSRKFGTGNRHTLATVPKQKGIDVRQALLHFHRRWYSANIMSLAVVGKVSLDDLEAMVVPLFLPVQDRGVEIPAWAEPFPPALQRRRVYCEPIADTRQLEIRFPIPDSMEYYPNYPCGYLTHLVGHEGPGSLLSALKAKRWCTSLFTRSEAPARGFAFFVIEVELTEQGVEHTDDIVKLTFQYLAMLRARKPHRDVWEERRTLDALSFRFEEPAEPPTLATCLVTKLRDFPTVPMEDMLVAWSWCQAEWRPELIDDMLARLTPENIRIQIIAKCFAQKCSQVEPWYGTKYLEQEIEPDKIKEWQTVELNPELNMPPPNEFVPSRLELEGSAEPTDESSTPAIVRDTPFMRLWFKQDNEFRLPKASVEFEFNSPLPGRSPRKSKLTALWTRLVEDSLQEATYAATLTELSWSFRDTDHSVIISIDGFDDKQHLLLGLIMDRVVHFKLDRRRFADMKDKLVRELKNKETHQPYEYADYQQDICLSERLQWTIPQLLDAVESLTPEMLEEFVPRFLRNVYVEGIAFGNLTRERALRLADIVESRIPKDAVPLLAQELLKERGLEIDKGGYYLREVENAIHSSSCAMVYLQVGVVAPRSAMLLELLKQMLKEPCFDTLRTKEQLGYYVWCSVVNMYGVQGLAVTVQGESHPACLEERIDAFLRGAQDYLEGMMDAEFLRHRAALAALLAERPKQIYAKKDRMWTEILSQMYYFDRAQKEVEILNTISKEELIQLYKKHISECSPDRRKLSVHVVSTAKGGAGEKRQADNKTDGQPTKITDIIEFKSRSRLCPRPVPLTAVPQRGM